jgi:hypothetical protein
MVRHRTFAEVKRAALFTFAAIFATLTLPLLNPAPASAYTQGNAWIHFNDVMCTQGGVVTGIYWAVDNYSVGPAGGDWGDRTIYPKVRVGSGAYNTLSFSIWCKKWGYYNYKAGDGQKNLSPYQSGLTYHYSSYF